jgi:hypothetical protein
MLDVYPSYDAFKALRRHKTDRRPRRRREEEGGEGELAISLKDNWRLPLSPPLVGKISLRQHTPSRGGG